MERLATILSRIPLWCRATAVISLGIALAVWFSAEATRQMDQRFLLGEVRIAAQRHTDLLSGLLSEAVVTGNRKAANAIVRQYTTDWTDITFIHVTDENAQVFVEWHRRPVVFGDGILKFESPVTYGGESFGILSMYVDLARSQDAVSEHVDGVTRRNALTLLAMMLVITALVNFVAMHPVKKVSDEVFRLLQVAGDDAPVGVGPDEISRLQGAVALLQKSLEELRARGEMVERIRKRDGDD